MEPSKSETLPDSVRVVPGPSSHWSIQTYSGTVYDGYVFDDDPSDLAKFIRWLAETQTPSQHRLTVQKVWR